MNNYIYLSLISFLAFFLKGVTGTGPTTVIVALSSLFLPSKDPIVIASFINIFGGIMMLNFDCGAIPRTFWLPICILMGIGSVLGALALSSIPNQIFALLLSFIFLITGIWFLAPDSQKGNALDETHWRKPRVWDLFTGLFSGFCGGFIGINAPVLIVHFGRFLNRKQLRRLLVVIFLPSALLQTGTFSYLNLLTNELILYGTSMIPCMVLGIWIGSKVHLRISQHHFHAVLGILLLFSAVRLIYDTINSPIGS